MKKLAVVVMLATVVFGMRLNAEDKITVKGSDTMVILAQRWAERYMATPP
jgi:phosphate transport system substrate-binding protein